MKALGALGVTVALALASAVVLWFLPASEAKLTSVTSSLCAAGILAAAVEFLLHSSRLSFYLAAHTKHRRRDFRVSIAYLIRIKVDGNYFLIRGARINQYQPVGGVFKWYPGALAVLEQLSVRDDSNIPIDEKSKHDLRIRIPGKHLPRLLSWFESRQNREVAPWREFQEELIKTGIVKAELFPSIATRYCSTHRVGPRWSPHFRTWEVLIFEVYELLPDAQQEAALRALGQSRDRRFCFASSDAISRLGANPRDPEAIPIAETAKWMEAG